MSVGDLLDRFVRGEVARIRSGPKTDWRYDLVKRFDLLPIAADSSGALFLRGDGEVLTLGWAAGEVPRVTDDAKAFIPALQRFVRDHPEAGELLNFHDIERQDIVVRRTRGSE